MNKRWWKEAVVYQIYPKSFYDSNHDGVGDIKGITAKLNYLQDLGVDVIWLSPVYESPMDDNGYDISDYYKIDDLFGTNEEMDELIREAKVRNIRIIMDLVINHSSDEHEWFKKAVEDKNSKYADYYIFKEGDGPNPPNNWRSIFGGSVWTRLDDGRYYMHTFAKKQPDLNWENKALREELYKMVNYWLDKGLGGFRVDAITYIKKDQTFKSLEPDGADGLANPNELSQNFKGIDKFLLELRHRTFDHYDCMTVAEAPGVPYDELGDYIGEDGYFDTIFDFSHTHVDANENDEWFNRLDWTIDDFKKLLFESQVETEKIGWGTVYLENHDQPRSISKYLPKGHINFQSTTMLATMYFLMKGTPYIYQGQEIGMSNCVMDNISEFDDIATHDQYKRALVAGLSELEALEAMNGRSRDNARTPFQWNDSVNAGFTEGIPWLKINSNYKEVNAKSQINENNSVYAYYKKLIRLRKSSEYSDVIVYGNIEPYIEEEKDIIAYYRTLKGKRILVISSFSSGPCAVKLEGNVKKVILNNYDDFQCDGENCELQGYQSVVLEI